MNSHAEL